MVRVEKIARATLDAEVSEKPERRKFTADYKLKILKAADACENGDGELGKLLRTEGLYSSNLLTWRRQRDEGTLAALEPKRRGRKPTKGQDAVSLENERLRREVARLKHRLQQAEVIIDVQKKVSTLLGITLPKIDDESGSNE
jgi:transposase-like protein